MNEVNLYKFQIDTIQKIIDSKLNYWFINGEMGCIAGDAVVKIQRCGATKKRTLRQLYNRRGNSQMNVRSLLDGHFGQNPVEKVVYSGIKKVMELTLEDGKKLKATPDHEILTRNGYQQLQMLTTDDEVVTSGSPAVCPVCGSPSFVKNESSDSFLYCRKCFCASNSKRIKNIGNKARWGDEYKEHINKDGYVVVTGVEARQYRTYPGESVLKHRFVMGKHLGRVLRSDEIVHHIDGNRLNNAIENLMITDTSSHATGHSEENTSNLHHDFYKRGKEVVMVPRFSRVVSVIDAGEIDTYDIKCASGFHNFIANGIVVHNCGKTIMTIKLAEYFYQQGKLRHVLVITPVGVQRQWVEGDLKKFSQVPYMAAFYSSKNTAQEIRDLNRLLYDNSVSVDGVPLLLYITANIDVFSSRAGRYEEFVEWAKKNKAMVVLDESHLAKDMNAARTKTIKLAFNFNQYKDNKLVSSVPATFFRLCLSGTPSDGNPIDLYAQYEFLKPDFFHMNFNNFKSRYSIQFRNKTKVNGRTVEYTTFINRRQWAQIKNVENNWEKWGPYVISHYGINQEAFELIHSQTEFTTSYKHLDELREKISYCTSVILKKDNLDLPDKIYRKKLLDMSPGQRKFYDIAKEELCVEYEGKVLNITNAMALMIRLRQITGGFCPMESLVKEKNEQGEVTPRVQTTQEYVDKINNKARALLEDIDILSGQPCVVVAYFTNEINYLYKLIQQEFPAYNIGVRDGKRNYTSGDPKCDAVKAFMAGEVQVLVAQEKTICQGFNFQVSGNMFFYSMDWSLIQRRQIEDRIHRIGISASPTYTDYLYRNSMDIKVYDALSSKKTIEEMLRAYGNVSEFLA